MYVHVNLSLYSSQLKTKILCNYIMLIELAKLLQWLLLKNKKKIYDQDYHL